MPALCGGDCPGMTSSLCECRLRGSRERVRQQARPLPTVSARACARLWLAPADESRDEPRVVDGGQYLLPYLLQLAR